MQVNKRACLLSANAAVMVFINISKKTWISGMPGNKILELQKNLLPEKGILAPMSAHVCRQSFNTHTVLPPWNHIYQDISAFSKLKDLQDQTMKMKRMTTDCISYFDIPSS